MINVIVSRDIQLGTVTLEKVYEWHQPHELELHKNDLEQVVADLNDRYGPAREVFTASARDLRNFCLAYPEYTPDDTATSPR